MQIFIRVIIFALVNLIGAFVIPLMFHLAHIMGVLPELTDSFMAWWGAGGLICWFLFMLVSIVYFFVASKKRFIYLSLPICMPFIYGVIVLIRFNMGA